MYRQIFKKIPQYVWIASGMGPKSDILLGLVIRPPKKPNLFGLANQASISLRLPQNGTQITKWNYIVMNVVTQRLYHQHYPLCVTSHLYKFRYFTRDRKFFPNTNPFSLHPILKWRIIWSVKVNRVLSSHCVEQGLSVQYRTGPCNTISYVTSHAFPHHFLSNVFMQLNNRLYKEYNLYFFKNLSALHVVQLVVQLSDPKIAFSSSLQQTT